jgi:crotonobetainyl-CoA:carnitine CoA-transferase CaiB-like acyl-CoA transferase
MPSEQSLAGLEVVELGPCIAVPFSAQLLAEGGARALANPVRLARRPM